MPLFHEKVQNLHCFITNEFCEMCECEATINSFTGAPIFSA